jgi:hypothetical protein
MNAARLRSRRHQRGEVYFEALVALPVVFFFFVQTWQLCQLFSANLVLSHAAYAAARAAVVVGPDNPLYYDFDDVDDLDPGTFRNDDVTSAAMIVASASPTLDPNTVEVECALGDGGGPRGYYAPLDATVFAEFMCPWWLSLVCLGQATLPLQQTATFVYQGAGYEFQ